MNKKVMRNIGFNEQIDNVEKGLCATCKKEIVPGHFRNKISEREFRISGMCQECQDRIFGKD